MASSANNSIVTKAKAMFGKFLQAEDYDQMVKLKTIPDLVKYLQRQPHYEKILKDVQPNTIHRGHFESLVRKNQVEQILKLVKLVYSKDKDFYLLDVVKQENEVILLILRMIINEESSDIRGSIPFFYDIPTHLNFTKMLNIKTFDDLLTAIEGTDYHEILKKYNTANKDEIRYIDIEHALEVYYYDLIFKTIDKFYHGELRNELYRLFKSKIDLLNITKIYRLKKFYQADPITIKNVLVNEYSQLSDKKIDELVMIENPDDLITYIDKKHHFDVADEDDYIYIEYYTGKVRYEIAKKYMYFSTEVPEIYSAFIILSEFELENLTNIIEGIRYQISENEIKQMLIY